MTSAKNKLFSTPVSTGKSVLGTPERWCVGWSWLAKSKTLFWRANHTPRQPKTILGPPQHAGLAYV